MSMIQKLSVIQFKLIILWLVEGDSSRVFDIGCRLGAMIRFVFDNQCSDLLLH